MNPKIIRKTHRYLGLIIGIQFIFWTVSGLYFSWTNLDRIHGDHFKELEYKGEHYRDLIPLSDIDVPDGIQSLELRDIAQVPHYWVNEQSLFNAETGEARQGITENEAIVITRSHTIADLEIESVNLITHTGNHHEYRGKSLPAYVISFDNNNKVKAYVSKTDGKFQSLRHRSWRWFDFLWMTHIMDYETRDNFNKTLLRAFSLFGLLTVVSGFTLWLTTSSFTRKA